MCEIESSGRMEKDEVLVLKGWKRVRLKDWRGRKAVTLYKFDNDFPRSGSGSGSNMYTSISFILRKNEFFINLTTFNWKNEINKDNLHIAASFNNFDKNYSSMRQITQK